VRSAKHFAWLTFGIAVLSAGCIPGKIRKLEIIRIGDVHLRSISQNFLDLNIHVDIQNPYSTSARLKDLTFTLALAGNPFGKGSLSGPIEMPSKSSTSLQVPVTVDCDKVSREDLDALFRPKIPYHLQGSVSLEKPIRMSKVEIDAYGNLKAPNRIEVVLEDRSVLSVISLKDTSIRDLMNLVRKGKLEFEIRNPFHFPIPLESLKYEIGFGKGSLAEGESAETRVLNPGMNRLSILVHPRPFSVAEGLLDSFLDQRAPALNLSSDLLLHQNDRDLLIHLRYRPE